jgi:transcriptional regulator with XRE-family HTH domain
VATSALDLDLLSAEVNDRIKRNGLSVRRAAAEIGCSPATLGRIMLGSESPNVPDWTNLSRVIQWLGASPSDFERGKRRPAHESTITDVEMHLRALPNITEPDAEALVAMVKAAYAKANEIRKRKKG